MDEIVSFNKQRWEELSEAGIEYARPWLDLTPESARQRIDPEGQLRQVDGARVLCLAASGGQQSAAFALLGARVTVLDLSENQLEKDRIAAAHYHLSVQTVQGDMQDLSRFQDSQFVRDSLSTVLNSLIRSGFVIRGLWEELGTRLEAEPGSWDHFNTIAPPFLTIWGQRAPRSSTEA